MSEPPRDRQPPADYVARAAARAQRLVVNRAASFEEAEAWDLEFWQSRTPQERLTAFAHLRRDVELAQAARAMADRRGES